MSARKVMLSLLEKFDNRPQRLDWLLERSLTYQKLDPRDRRLVMEVVYGVVRRRLSLDFIINRYLDTDRLRENEALMRLLRIGTYQLVHLDRVPEHAAVNETVKLAKGDRRTMDVAGVVNAVLRTIIRNRSHLPQPGTGMELCQRLSILYSHPRWLTERWLKRLGLAKTKALLAFNNTRPDVHLRRKMKGLTHPQFDAEARSICENGKGYLNLFYRLKKHVLPESIILLREGLCTVQAPSAGWVVGMLDARAGDRIADICAAPGGKTSLISDLVAERGAVVACDLRFRRARSIAETVSRMSLDNVYTIVCDGAALPFTGRFDKVLLDAPCSGTGVMHRHPDARWTSTEEDLARLVALQKKLLDGVCEAVAEGGVLVYATCSIEPEENEMQVEDFLARHADFELEHAPGVIPGTYVDLDGRLCITPHEHKTDGMFAVRLRRKKG